MLKRMLSFHYFLFKNERNLYVDEECRFLSNLTKILQNSSNIDNLKVDCFGPQLVYRDLFTIGANVCLQKLFDMKLW